MILLYDPYVYIYLNANDQFFLDLTKILFFYEQVIFKLSNSQQND